LIDEVGYCLLASKDVFALSPVDSFFASSTDVFKVLNLFFCFIEASLLFEVSLFAV